MTGRGLVNLDPVACGTNGPVILGTEPTRWARHRGPVASVTDQEALRAAVTEAIRDVSSPLAPMARACRACAELLTVGDGVSFALIGDRQHRETLYAGDSTANVLEELQFTLGEGPCFEAFENGGPVLVPDLRATAAPRWPAFAHAAEEHQVAGLFVFPLGWGAIRIGAMSVYRRQAGPLSVDELATVLQIADVAVWALMTLHRSPGDVETVNWTDETASHRQVHQATGVLMARLNVSAADAIALMRAHAFLVGALIGEVAADVLAGHLQLGADEP